MENQFKVGDVVQLKSDGPKMTVIDVHKDTSMKPVKIDCVWFDGVRKLEGSFPPDALKTWEGLPQAQPYNPGGEW